MPVTSVRLDLEPLWLRIFRTTAETRSRMFNKIDVEFWGPLGPDDLDSLRDGIELIDEYLDKAYSGTADPDFEKDVLDRLGLSHWRYGNYDVPDGLTKIVAKGRGALSHIEKMAAFKPSTNLGKRDLVSFVLTEGNPDKVVLAAAIIAARQLARDATSDKPKRQAECSELEAKYMKMFPDEDINNCGY